MKQILKGSSITVVICIATSLFLGALTGVLLSDAMAEKLSRDKNSVMSQETNDEKTREDVLDDITAIEIKILFTLCEHEIVKSENIDSSTFSETKNKYNEHGILSFKDGFPVLYKTIEGFCPEHYVVRINGDFLAVYRRNAVSFEEEYIMDITDAVEDIDEEFKEELKKGVPFSSFEEINKYFENADS